MTKDLKILTSFWFLTGLILLLFNDFFFKELFNNWFTGKFSDVAGLFIFPVFWAALFPKHKTKIFIFTGIFFIFWKLSFSQDFIDNWNNLLPLKINRVIDFTDLFALLILPISYHIFTASKKMKTLKISPVVPFIVSAFAFCATSYHRDFDYDSTYHFSISKNELLEKINLLKNKNFGENLPLSLNIKNSNNFIREHSDTSWFYVSRYKYYTDTIFNLEKKKIDTIIQYKVPVRDTIYVSRSGVFFYLIPAKEHMQESTTGYCQVVPAKIKLQGNEISSSLTLLNIYTHNCMGMFEKKAEKNEKENLLKTFEMEFIEKIKNATE